MIAAISIEEVGGFESTRPVINAPNVDETTGGAGTAPEQLARRELAGPLLTSPTPPPAANVLHQRLQRPRCAPSLRVIHVVAGERCAEIPQN